MFSLEFWLILAFIFILGELLTSTFFLFSLGIGSAFAGLVNYLGFDPIVQLLVFVIISLICIIASKPLANKLTKNSPDKKSNSERLIGKEVIVIEEIKENEMGLVKYSGDVWKAKSSDNIPVGDKAIVENIIGVKLIVKKQ
ncbi:MAG: NfeD family protein [Methanobacteriaceae archaeon]|jgi:membrane protein implicated in regulation of membrane protease activity|nr:NfeD family protein [Methanobacteriaceae archaeon]